MSGGLQERHGEYETEGGIGREYIDNLPDDHDLPLKEIAVIDEAFRGE